MSERTTGRGAGAFDLRRQARLVLWGGAVAFAVGAAIAGFLRTLEWANRTRTDGEWLVWFLPLGGAAVAWVQHRFASGTLGGARHVVQEIRRHRVGVPFRMAPMVWLGSAVTHLLGGSAGREGAALQISGGFFGGAAAAGRLSPLDRSLLLIAALSSGFGAAFGVPVAGVVFALEVSPGSRRNRLAALPASVVAAVTARFGRNLVGVPGEPFPTLAPTSFRHLLAVAILAPLFGLVAWLFLQATERWRSTLNLLVPRPELRPVVGGVAVIALTLLVGSHRFNGASSELLVTALGGGEVGHLDWAAKLVFTTVTVGSGFLGGEVLPLSVMGATAGSALADVFGGPPELLAPVGLAATVGAGLNAPIACAVMGTEWFGIDAFVPLAVACVIARVCSGRHSLYAGARTIPVDAEFV